jgi:fimbrial isopeptide formation D2 family protein/LPXTG-motif cell wall-anchored protein
VYDPQQHRTHNGGSNAGEGLLYSSLPLRHPLAHPQLHKLKGKNVKMKRKITRVLAALFAMVMLVSCMSLSAFAADPEDTDTVDGITYVAKQGTAPNDHIYEVYQIFTGNVGGDDGGILSQAKWGANVKQNYSLTVDSTTTLTGDTTADEATDVQAVVKAIQNFSGSQSELAAFVAQLVDFDSKPANVSPDKKIGSSADKENAQDYLEQPVVAASNGGASTSYYSFSGIPMGYYLIKDSAGTVTNTMTDPVYTLYVIDTSTGTLTFSPKGKAPTVDKYISDSADAYGTVGNDAALKAIGDTVTYTLKGSVSDNIAYYNSYFFKFTDTLSEGLTFNSLNDDDDSIKAGSVKVVLHALASGTKDTYVDQDVTQYFYTSFDKSANQLTVSIQDLFAFDNLATKAESSEGAGDGWTAVKIDANTTVYVTYTATLNAKAVASYDADKANNNKVTLTYYNDPNDSGTGRTKDEPTPDPETPPTPQHPDEESTAETVLTYTAALTLEKQNINNEPLNGAVFSLTLKEAADDLSEQMRVTQSDAKFELYADTDATEDVDGAKISQSNIESTEVKDSTGNKYPLANVGAYTTENVEENGATKEVKKGVISTAMQLYTSDDKVLYWELNYSTDTSTGNKTYTTRNPFYSTVSANELSHYVDVTKVYTKGEVGEDTEDVNKAGSFTVKGTVGDDGLLTFEGLGLGTYTVKELTAPANYQVCDDFDITLGITYDATSTTGNKWKLTCTSAGADVTTGSDGAFHIVVKDSAMGAMPSTGGIGTTIFYVVGSALAVGAIVLLITKKRMNNEVG